MNDSALRRAILDELEFLPGINPTDIGVTTHNGVICLSGHVRTYAEKIAIERAVKRIKGVKAVADEIQVRLPGDLGIGDELIATRCLDVFQWDSTLADEALQVNVQHGWVTLEGEVDWQYQKEAAEKAVRKLHGVVGINNLLRVSPKAMPDDIKSRIEAALARKAELDPARIRVTVEGHCVNLEGHVRQWSERKQAEATAWAVAGVSQVNNHLLIS